MDSLIDGMRRFQREVYPKRRKFFQQLATGQQPEVLFVGCSDSRIDPNLLTQTEPGELFVLRNAGNIVPPYGASTGGEAAAVEYAVAVLGVKDIVVCGHSGCGAIGALLAEEAPPNMPALKDWLRQAEATRRISRETGIDPADSISLMSAVKANVLVQLRNLATHPTVVSGLEQGTLALHGCAYRIDTGGIAHTAPVGATYEWRDLDPERHV